jgi:hypothetical protein
MKVLFKWLVILFAIPVAIYLLVGYVVNEFNLSNWSSSGILGLAFLSFAWIIFAFLALAMEELQKMEDEK